MASSEGDSHSSPKVQLAYSKAPADRMSLLYWPVFGYFLDLRKTLSNGLFVLTHLFLCLSVCLSLSLSLSLYIYIYTHTHTQWLPLFAEGRHLLHSLKETVRECVTLQIEYIIASPITFVTNVWAAFSINIVPMNTHMTFQACCRPT